MNRQGPGKIEWERFDRFGGVNPRGRNWALIIDGIEIYDFWGDGRVTAPVGSPAETRNEVPRWVPQTKLVRLEEGVDDVLYDQADEEE